MSQDLYTPIMLNLLFVIFCFFQKFISITSIFIDNSNLNSTLDNYHLTQPLQLNQFRTVNSSVILYKLELLEGFQPVVLLLHPKDYLIQPGQHLENTPIDPNQPNPTTSYTGKILNFQNSKLALTRHNNRLAGLIWLNKHDSTSEFYLQPVENSENLYHHVVYQMKHVNFDPFNSALHGFDQEPEFSNECQLGPSEFDDFWDTPIVDYGEDISPKFRAKRSPLSFGHPNYSRSRGRRAYNMEVLVATDPSVIEFHGSHNVHSYIVTLMNIVDEIFKDETMQANLRIVLSDIVLLNHGEPGSDIIKTTADLSLKNVCNWANSKKKRKGRPKPDITVFLTRKIFGSLGYAPTGGMCTDRSCSINYEKGFSGAFFIAHEIGHVLGMGHDDLRDRICAENSDFNSVMQPFITSNFRTFTWSPCSNRVARTELPKLYCLMDYPYENDDVSNVKYELNYLTKHLTLPGRIFTEEEQCRMEFGDEFTVCQQKFARRPSLCAQLICGKADEKTWCLASKSGWALDGTECENDGVVGFCVAGECVV